MKIKKRKNKKNKKAFTMVELLAAITILGILFSIGSVSVTRIIQKSKENFYKTTKNTFVQAGQSYVDSNRSLLPKKIGEVKKYTLKELYNARYLTETLKDENGDECDQNKSVFFVYKSSKSNYKYSAVLYCPSCTKKGTCKDDSNSNNPNITGELKDCGDDLKDDPVATITLDGGEKENGVKPTVVSYSYEVLKNNVSVYSSGTIRTKEKEKINLKINLEKYLPGPLKLVVTVTNSNGYSNLITLKADANYCKGKVLLNCGTVTYEENNDTSKGSLFKSLKTDQDKCEKDDWLNATNYINYGRKVWVECTSGGNTKCQTPTYSEVFTKDNKKSTIKISDTDGNTNKCDVYTCIDRTYPTITAEIYKATSSGTIDGNALYKYEIKGTKTKNSSTNNITNWINKSSAPYGVIIVVTSKDKTSGMDTLSHAETSDGLTESQAETATYGSKSNFPSTTTNSLWLKKDGNKKYLITGTDNAGNTSTIEFTVKLDTTDPKVPTVKLFKTTGTSTPVSETGLSEYVEDTWYSGSVFTKAYSSSDSMSGFNIYQYTTRGVEGTNNNKTSTYRNITTEGISYIKYRACDKAGNCSNYTNEKTIKLDRTAPTCEVSSSCSKEGEGEWCLGTITLSATGTDSYSDVASKSVNKTTIDYDTNGETITETIKDVAGNTRTCTKKVYRDASKPTCVSSGGNTNWTNQNITLIGKCSDTGGSECKTSTISRSFTTNTNLTNQSPGTVEDNAGNSTRCPANQTVKIDKTAPTCTSSGGSTSWTNDNVTLTGSCSDTGGSGCKSATVKKTYTTNTNLSNKSPGTVKDNAGNSTTCPANQTVKIDKTAPVVKKYGNSIFDGQFERCNSGTDNIFIGDLASKAEYALGISYAHIEDSGGSHLNYFFIRSKTDKDTKHYFEYVGDLSTEDKFEMGVWLFQSTGSYTIVIGGCDNAGNCADLGTKTGTCNSKHSASRPADNIQYDLTNGQFDTRKYKSKS